MTLFRLFLCEFNSNGIFNLDILTHDEYVDDENILLTGFLAVEISKAGIYVHFMGLDVIDTATDRWFLP